MTWIGLFDEIIFSITTFVTVDTLILGDTVIVIDGKPEHHWWRGQNQRTFDIGDFPRKFVQNVAGKKAKDISKPLKNSFIHTGHGSHRGKTWGSPSQIDDLYLRNPMTPPDMHNNQDSSSASPNTSTEADANQQVSFHHILAFFAFF